MVHFMQSAMPNNSSICHINVMIPGATCLCFQSLSLQHHKCVRALTTFSYFNHVAHTPKTSCEFWTFHKRRHNREVKALSKMAPFCFVAVKVFELVRMCEQMGGDYFFRNCEKQFETTHNGNRKIRFLMKVSEQNRHQKVFSRGVYVCAGGLDILNLTKHH